MDGIEFDWDHGNVKHLADHDVKPVEFERLMANDPLDLIPTKKRPRRAIPAFATEAEEAEWWFQNREVHEKQLVTAAKAGEAQILTKEKLVEHGFEEDSGAGGY